MAHEQPRSGAQPGEESTVSATADHPALAAPHEAANAESVASGEAIRSAYVPGDPRSPVHVKCRNCHQPFAAHETVMLWCPAEFISAKRFEPVAIVKHAAGRYPKCKFCPSRLRWDGIVLSATLLCDFEVGRTLGGDPITCEAPVCVQCARRVGDKDFCPKHPKEQNAEHHR
jgi:hypothetical protein